MYMCLYMSICSQTVNHKQFWKHADYVTTTSLQQEDPSDVLSIAAVRDKDCAH